MGNHNIMILRQACQLPLGLLILLSIFANQALASYGDRLPSFKHCVKVCKEENCASGHPTSIPLLHQLLFWDCPAECDYTCQHIITDQRVAASEDIVQFHGEWPIENHLEPTRFILDAKILHPVRILWHGQLGL